MNRVDNMVIQATGLIDMLDKDMNTCGACMLSCSLATAQVKFNVNRVDNMVIQAIALLDTLDKDINTFVMRVREWYSWHFPELVRVVSDNYLYARLTLLIKDKAALSEALLPGAALSSVAA